MDLQKEYERIRKYADKAYKRENANRYDLRAKDYYAITRCSPDLTDMVFLAFSYGFEKGCRATKKAAKV